jgi:two-component system sensor histidine kinase KdpD
MATMLVALPSRESVDVANIDMLFLPAVFISAIWLGRGPAIMSAFLGVALFDFFFVPPYLSFAVADAKYLITFAVMLSVGLITSHLVSRLAERTEQAQESERQTRLLHAFGRDLGIAMHVEQVAGR